MATGTAPDNHIEPVVLQSVDGMSTRYVHPGVRDISRTIELARSPVGLCRRPARRQHLDGGGQLLSELVARSLSG